MNMKTDSRNTVTSWYSSLGSLSLGGITLKRKRVAIPAATVVENIPVMHLSALLTLQQTFGWCPFSGIATFQYLFTVCLSWDKEKTIDSAKRMCGLSTSKTIQVPSHWTLTEGLSRFQHPLYKYAYKNNKRTYTPYALRTSRSVTFTECDTALLMQNDESTADWLRSILTHWVGSYSLFWISRKAV